MDDLRNEQRLIYDAINGKFNAPNLIMTCRKINTEKSYSIWYARLACLTANSNRIVVAIVPLEVYHSIDSTAPLDQLRWTGLQTRETTDQQLLTALPTQACPARPKVAPLSGEVLRTALFKVAVKGDTAWTYVSDQLPSLRVDLLLDKPGQEFRSSGTLEQCLDIFQTCLAFQLLA